MITEGRLNEYVTKNKEDGIVILNNIRYSNNILSYNLNNSYLSEEIY